MAMSIRSSLAVLLLIALPGNLVPAYGQKQTKPLFDVRDFGIKGNDNADIDVKAELRPVDAKTVELRVRVILPDQYYISSMDPKVAGPTAIRLTDAGPMKPLSDAWQADREPKTGHDPDLNKPYEKFFKEVTWSLKLQCTTDQIPADLTVKGEMSGQFCSTGEGGTEGVCKPLIPPRRFTATLTSAPPADATSPGHSQTEGSAASEPASGAGKSRWSVVIVPEIGYGQNKKPAPVKYTLSFVPENAKAGDLVTFQVRADIEQPWHTFAIDQDPDMAGIPTQIDFTETTGLEAVEAGFKPSAEPTIEKPLDDIIQRVHFDAITWTRQFKMTSDTARVAGAITFQLCNDGSCTNPTTVKFTAASGAPQLTGADSVPGSRGSAEESSGGQIAVDLESDAESQDIAGEGLFAFIITAMSAGFLALLTPCVFPMVPVTVAFFLKQSEKKAGNPVGLAIVYCLGIVGTFTILGLLVAIAYGPTKLNEFASNRWLNLIFAGLFMAFSLMLMGMFELRMPSWLLTWSSKRESAGGVVGTLFMALTFTLVSFTCTFAFVGALLVLAAKGDRLWPIIGMLAFSSAFASPFFILALFPSMLKKLPKSGGWMNTVKVTMGLVELALVLKFLSVADIGFSPDRLPNLLDTQSFLIGWIVIAIVTGLYLLNMFRMAHDMPAEGISAVRCLFAILFLCLGGYIGAGVFSDVAPNGWLWQQIHAFAPPSKPKPESLLDFRVAVAQATEQQKLLFIDFTGVNCVNCRRMEATVLSSPFIHEKLSKFVQVQLYTDEVPGIRDANLRNELLELNRNLQAEWFGDVTLPGYAVVTPDGKNVINRFKGLDKSGGEEFLQFIDAGIDRWNEYLREKAVAGHGGDPPGKQLL